MLNYITWNVDPVLFHLGSLQVRWYGLLWALGFLLGYFIMRNIYRREKMSDDSLDKLLLYMLLFTVVGARLGHCMFYQPNYYLAPFVAMFGGTVDPVIAQYGMTNWEAFFEMFMPWKGGLASHGGAIGILLGLWLYVRSYNKSTKKAKDNLQRINYIWILDRIVVAVCLVGALIRVGNVTNHEIYGTPTSLPWGFVFMRGQEQFCGTVDNYTPCMGGTCCPPNDWLPCHPTGLYEAFFCLVAMGILLWMYYKRDIGHKQPGLMFGTFLVIIFGSRIGIEFLKNVQVDFERDMFFDMGQWLSVPFVLVGIGMIVWSFVRRKKAIEG